MTYFDNSLFNHGYRIWEIYGNIYYYSFPTHICLKGSLVTLLPPESARLAGPLVGGPHGAVHGVRAAGAVIDVAPPPAGEIKLLAVATTPVQMGDTLARTCNVKKAIYIISMSCDTVQKARPRPFTKL